ncbi:hypothetical protein [Xanthomonas maliensis]|uniref:hypothetical protein n=1 Tax=Xanthomonas maliensis TaxID=1321368 RepID=UPI0012DBF046|nr:hypothetical protein [Xanthomonas maliensis]
MQAPRPPSRGSAPTPLTPYTDPLLVGALARLAAALLTASLLWLGYAWVTS